MPHMRSPADAVPNGQKDSKLAMMNLAAIDQSSPEKSANPSPKEAPAPWEKNSGEPLYLSTDIITNDTLPLHLALDTNISPQQLNNSKNHNPRVPDFNYTGNEKLLLPPQEL